MQENGSVSFVAILFELRRKTDFNIFDKHYHHCFLSFADMIAQKVIAFSSLFSRE